MIVGLCVSILFPLSALAADPPERLIDQLGSPRHRERQQAAAALMQQGSAAIPLLEKARKHSDLEVRRQVESLLEHLIPRAEAEEVLASPKIRLGYKDMPALDALIDFSRKTRLPMALDVLDRSRLSRQRITLQTDDLPVWEAYRRLCAAAGIAESHGPADSTVSVIGSSSESTRPPGSSGGSSRGRPSSSGGFSSSPRRPTVAPLLLHTGPTVSLPTAHSGALRIQAIDSSTRRTPEGEAIVPLLFSIDERIRLDRIEYLRVERARDVFGDRVTTHGYSLSTEDPRQEAAEIVGMESRSRPRYIPPCRLDLKFDVPNKRVKVLDELTGFVGIRVETPVGLLCEVPDVVKASDSTMTARDGTTVKIVSAEIDPDTKRLRMKVEIQRPEGVSDPPRPFGGGQFGQRGGSSRSTTSLMRNDLEQQGLIVLDAKGDTVTLWRAELAPKKTDPPGPREFTLVYEPTKEQAAGAIRLQVSGRRLTVIEVPFTLRNVPLP